VGALKAEREYRQKEAERSGKPRRGGAPAGNLNASRHPWRTLWRRGAVKPELQWIVPLMQRYADALEADKGGAENVSAAARSLIEVAAMARGCASLILSCAGQYGVVEPADDGSNRWNISPGLRELPKFLKTEVSALLGLGLERRTREITLADYLGATNAGTGASGQSDISDKRESTADYLQSAGSNEDTAGRAPLGPGGADRESQGSAPLSPGVSPSPRSSES
jgi:hypothetical protein